MYSVSSAYKIAAMEPAQEHRLTGTIGSVSFDENNIVAGSFNIQKQSTDSNSMVLGSCYIGQLTATFTGINLARGAWLNKAIAPSFALKLADNSWETVPLGVYKIKEAVHTAEGVQVTAYDNMIKFDKKIKNKKTTLGFVTDSMYTFINLCCTKCNVTLGMTKAQIDALPNGYRQQNDIEIYGDAKADDFANDIETYRDLLFWCAQTVGCFATIDRAGQLIFRQYTQNIDDTISDEIRLSGANFEDYVTHFTGILVTDMDTNDDTYYGYDTTELLTQINETSEDLTEANDDLTDNLAAQAELDEEYAQHQITEEEYIAQKAVLTAEEKSIRQLIKKLNKRLGWLEAELQDAQNDEEGAIMNLGANPFVQYDNLTKRDNTRRRILGAMSNISYTPFTASMVCGAHYDLGDVIQFTGGHSDNDICCVMSWSYTHNMGTELEGFGTDSAQQQVRVRNKAEKQADRANSTASNTGHTYVADADPDTTTGAPRSSKQGDVWMQTNQDTEIISLYPITFENLYHDSEDDRDVNVTTAAVLNENGYFNVSLTARIQGYSATTGHYNPLQSSPIFKLNITEPGTYKWHCKISYTANMVTGTVNQFLGFVLHKNKTSAVAPSIDPNSVWHDGTQGDMGANVSMTQDQYFEYSGQFIFPNPDDAYDTGERYIWLLFYRCANFAWNVTPDPASLYMSIQDFYFEKVINTTTGETDGGVEEITGESYLEDIKYNQDGEWKTVEYVAKAEADTSESAGGSEWNGINTVNDNKQVSLSLKKNVVRAWYKADPPQVTRNFSQLCVRFTGKPDKNIDIEAYANHTFENKDVKSDDENAFYIKCGGVGGSGSYCAYKLTGLVVGAKYYFNFAYNFSDNAAFGDDTTKGLGLVFNTTGTISTDNWSGAEDTFDEENLYYSMKRSTTKHYADFSFEATATTMYMCVVTADVTGGADITLVLNEFVIADSERELIRNIYLYDYEKNEWLKYRPFGSITGGGDEGAGSVVAITPTLLSGTKVADYSIDGENGSLYAPDNSYTLPIASANTLGGIKVGQNLSIDQNGILSATGGGGGASSLDDLSDVDITSPSNGQVLKYNNGEWVNEADTGGTQAIELTQQQYDALSAQEKADSTKVYYVTDAPSSDLDIDDLQNVNISNPSSGQILKYNGSEWINSSSGAGISNCYYGQVLSNAITLSSPVNAGEVGSFDFVIPRNDLYGNGFIVSVMPSGGWAKDANGNDIGFIYMTNSYFQEDSTTPKPYDSCDLYVHCVFINTTNDAVKSFSYITSNYVLLS